MMTPFMPISPAASGTSEAELLPPGADADLTAESQAVEVPWDDSKPSELDTWSLRHYRKRADQLQGGEVTELMQHVLRLAKTDKKTMNGRDQRMMADQELFELDTHYTPLGKEDKDYEDQIADGDQSITLPDPFIFPMKVANMLAGAGLRMNMPAPTVGKMANVQRVENYARWWWKEAADQAVFNAGSDPMWQMAHHVTLRGWITARIMPDSTNPDFPFELLVEDPLYVYPRMSRKGIMHLTHQYEITVDAARAEYPEAEDLLENRDDEDTVNIVGFYDHVYHMVIMDGKVVGRSSAATDAGAQQVVKPPVRHQLRDLRDRPFTPWVVVLALGDLSGPTSNGKRNTALLGPGILYAMREVYNHVCRLTSMLLTQVALDTNPSSIITVKPGQEVPEPLSLKPGARNYMWDGQEVKLLNPSPNPSNLQPLFSIVVDRLNRATLPAVIYGEGGSIQSGYGVSLLQNPTTDVLKPYGNATVAATRLLLRRALEITATITAQTQEPLMITERSGLMQRAYGNIPFDPQLIYETGTRIDVTFGEITAQDRVALAQTVMGLVTTGIMDKFSARQELGMDDPMLVAQRVGLQAAMENPMAIAQLGPLSDYASDEELMQAVYQVLQNMQAQGQMQPGAGPGGPQGPQTAPPPNTPTVPTQVLPMERQVGPQGMAGQAPPAQDAAAAMQRERDAMIARLSGGSLPAGG